MQGVLTTGANKHLVGKDEEHPNIGRQDVTPPWGSLYDLREITVPNR